MKEMTRGKWCSHKKATLAICCINIAVALYLLHSLYTSLYIYPFNSSLNVVRYTLDQTKKMEEAKQIRKQSEPTELVNVVKEMGKEVSNKDRAVKYPVHLKQMVRDEIIGRLKGLGGNANMSEQRETVESWRKDKLKEVEELIRGKLLNSTTSQEEARILVRALSSDWSQLSEQIGLWIPVEVNNQEHYDKPEGADEHGEEIIAGPHLPPECHAEPHSDYDGEAVKWGLTHPKESAYDCCQACFEHSRRAKPGEKKCNIWVYCPSERGCYSPDIYQHKHMECWLKYAEQPKLNFKDKYPESYRNTHSNVPVIVPWVSGVVTA